MTPIVQSGHQWQSFLLGSGYQKKQKFYHVVPKIIRTGRGLADGDVVNLFFLTIPSGYCASIEVQLTSGGEFRVPSHQPIIGESSLIFSFDAETMFLDHPTEAEIASKRRIDGGLRRKIFASGLKQCQLTGLSIEAALEVCHIVPWSADVSARTDTENCLLLAATIHRLFDANLIRIAGDGSVHCVNAEASEMVGVKSLKGLSARTRAHLRRRETLMAAS